MNKVPVVVFRSNDNSFLDVLRSLGEANIPSIPVVFTWPNAGPWLSEKSVYFKNPIFIENPAENEYKAKEQIIDLGKNLLKKYNQKCLLMNTSDTGLFFTQKYFEELKPYFMQMGHGDFNEPIISELNKANFAKILAKNNISIPLTFSVSQKSDIEMAIKNIPLPCVYKPVLKDITNSFANTHDKEKAIEFDTKNGLAEALEKELRNGYDLILQEKIFFDKLEDEVTCYIYSDRDYNIRAIGGIHKVHVYPDPYGTAITVKEYCPDELFDIAAKLAKALNWHGTLAIEFMYDKINKRWVIIEANMRAWLANYFPTALGINYTEMLYLDAMNILPPFEGCKKWGKGGFYQSIFTFVVKKFITEYKDERIAFLKILDFIQQNNGKIVFANMNFYDESPGLYEYSLLKERYKNSTDIIDEIFCLMKENNKSLIEYKENKTKKS